MPAPTISWNPTGNEGHWYFVFPGNPISAPGGNQFIPSSELGIGSTDYVLIKSVTLHLRRPFGSHKAGILSAQSKHAENNFPWLAEMPIGGASDVIERVQPGEGIPLLPDGGLQLEYSFDTPTSGWLPYHGSSQQVFFAMGMWVTKETLPP